MGALQQAILGQTPALVGWTPLVNFKAGADISNPKTVTSPAVNTSTAKLIVVELSCYDQNPTGNFSDSKGNTWNMTTIRGTPGSAVTLSVFFWCVPTSVGAGHTFSFTTLVNSYPAMAGLAFTISGTPVSPLDQQNGATTSGATSLATGSITPGFDNELIIAGFSTLDPEGSTPTINQGMTLIFNGAVSGASVGAGIAWKVQTTATAINPTCSWTNSIGAAASIISLKS